LNRTLNRTGRGGSYDRLLEFMFAAIDRARTGRIGFCTFVEWLLTMAHGGAEDRRRSSPLPLPHS
jgi:hypothetical protein